MPCPVIRPTRAFFASCPWLPNFDLARRAFTTTDIPACESFGHPARQRTPIARRPACRLMPAMVESRMGTVVSGQRPVSHPRSSNRTCRFPASGSPAGFTARHATGPLGAGLEAQNAEFSMNDIECESAIAAPLHLVPSHEEPAHTLGAQGSRVILAPLPNVCPRHKCRHSSP